MDNLMKIQNVLKSTASLHGGEDQVFMAFQLALCAHMTLEQQGKFLQDAKHRGLLDDNGELVKNRQGMMTFSVKTNIEKFDVKAESLGRAESQVVSVLQAYEFDSVATITTPTGREFHIKKTGEEITFNA